LRVNQCREGISRDPRGSATGTEPTGHWKAGLQVEPVAVSKANGVLTFFRDDAGICEGGRSRTVALSPITRKGNSDLSLFHTHCRYRMGRFAIPLHLLRRTGASPKDTSSRSSRLRRLVPVRGREPRRPGVARLPAVLRRRKGSSGSVGGPLLPRLVWLIAGSDVDIHGNHHWVKHIYPIKVWWYRPGVGDQESEWRKLAAASSRVPP